MTAPLSEQQLDAIRTALSRHEPATDEQIRAAVSDVLSTVGHNYQPLIAERLRRAESAVPAIVRRLLDAEARVAELESADRTVYRASHDSIVIGLYTTPAAAREHCEAYARREQPDAVLNWIADEEDELSPYELAAQVGDDEDLTGYVVTPLTVAAAYDPDGDE